MKKIPCEKLPDSTFALALEGYPFVLKGCKKHQSDIFQTRIMLKKTYNTMYRAKNFDGPAFENACYSGKPFHHERCKA